MYIPKGAKRTSSATALCCHFALPARPQDTDSIATADVAAWTALLAAMLTSFILALTRCAAICIEREFFDAVLLLSRHAAVRVFSEGEEGCVVWNYKNELEL